jgi:hypothetical protein
MKDKWGRRLFVTGAILLILLGLVHSLSLLEKQVPANETERQLLDLMSNYKFDVMGSMRSMNDFLRGFSVAFMVGMIGLGVLDLVLARERAGLEARRARQCRLDGRDGRCGCALLFYRAGFVDGRHTGDLCAGMVEAAGIC